ncbi:MAG TPA: FAD-dependent oxidoreductase [Candidatus Paceibacterota bacterium]
MKIKKEIKHKYIVIDTRRETHDVLTLKIKGGNNSIPSYIPGQFITVYFPETGTPEGKSYSISSSPHEDTMNITIKTMGKFSNRLFNMKNGDEITASLPYGFFFSELDNTDMVIITGGIGIAPFRSMIYDNLLKNPLKNITLYYSNRFVDDIIFKKEFDDLEKKHSSFNVKYFITRQIDTLSDKLPKNMTLERIKIENIIKNTKDNNTKKSKEKEFFICGSISFVRDMWRGLRESGIPEEFIYTEAFFSH